MGALVTYYSGKTLLWCVYYYLYSTQIIGFSQRFTEFNISCVTPGTRWLDRTGSELGVSEAENVMPAADIALIIAPLLRHNN
ncbi:hypothetical protein J6590_013163 [Homalodisca vitripennis]|nr:hypothetical protein J6590_013163 [Homalodisca vitripennis]